MGVFRAHLLAVSFLAKGLDTRSAVLFLVLLRRMLLPGVEAGFNVALHAQSNYWMHGWVAGRFVILVVLWTVWIFRLELYPFALDPGTRSIDPDGSYPLGGPGPTFYPTGV